MMVRHKLNLNTNKINKYRRPEIAFFTMYQKFGVVSLELSNLDFEKLTE